VEVGGTPIFKESQPVETRFRFPQFGAAACSDVAWESRGLNPTMIGRASSFPNTPATAGQLCQAYEVRSTEVRSIGHGMQGADYEAPTAKTMTNQADLSAVMQSGKP
jgi:hypothetical protein